MSGKDKKKKSLVLKNSKNPLEKSKDFNDYISQVEITPEKEAKIREEFLLKEVADGVIDILPAGKIINTILKSQEKAEEIIREKKEEFLLAQYFSKTTDNTESIKQLKDFLTNPFGVSIFNKILQITDNTLPDPNLLHHLSNALTKVIRSKDFENLFDKHKYVLSRIEILSSQALTLLSDYETWPDFQLENVVAYGGKIANDWVSAFVKEYSIKKKISDPEKFIRVKICLKELERHDLISAQIINPPNKIRVTLTAAGNEIVEYINIS